MKLYTDTVSSLLWEILNKLMKIKELESFQLVGGTSLSLLLGHRISDDIDFFTDADYNTVDFKVIDKRLFESFKYVSFLFEGNSSIGKSYFIGNIEDEMIKVDMFYTEAFIFPHIEYNGLRISSLEEIIAMKLEVICNGGRKKDFWDIHELMEHFSWKEMLSFYERRYPYGSSQKEVINQLTDFDSADSDFDPKCLKGKYWELIKLDIEDSINENFH
jgi:predicted nucleotidyltransferase component of viral defense system